MGSLSDYAENKLWDHVFNASYTPATALYLALCTAAVTDPQTGSTMSEVSNSGAYVRKAISFSAAASRSTSNSSSVTYDEATGSWGTISHWAVVDTATHGAGNIICYGAFGNAKSIVSGNTVVVPSGEISVSFFDNPFFPISDYLSNELLDHTFRNEVYASPNTYVGLTTVTVGNSDTGSTITEPAGDGYARVQVNVNGGSSPTWATASSATVSNADAISFPVATASWGTVTSVVVCDASTNGNLLLYDNSMADKAIGEADTAVFAASSLSFRVA